MKKGFTLIELLIVIAIIGILASIIITSMGSSRTRAKDARIASDLKQVIDISEMIVSSDGSYVNVANNSDIAALINDINSQGGNNIRRWANAIGYCAEAQLGGGRWGCVNSGLTTAFNLTSNPACNGAANNNGAPSNFYCQ